MERVANILRVITVTLLCNYNELAIKLRVRTNLMLLYAS
jgi:hypothetical protein